MGQSSMRNNATGIGGDAAVPDAMRAPASVADHSPRFSVDVIIPMRDGAATIFAALAGVFAQTLAPRHIFVIDDGSEDGGGALVRARHFPFLTVIETSALGVSHARNVGIGHSRADFIAFLDCDDLWCASKLEEQLAVAKENQQAAVVTCGSMSLDMQHRPIAGTRYTPTLRGHVFEKSLKQGYVRGGLSSNMLVRRSALLAVGGFDESIAIGEDLDLWLRLARRYVFDYCRAPLAQIVENPASTMRRIAGPTRRRELLLQPLSCLEKWIDNGAPNRWIMAFGARLILAHTVREQLTLEELWRLREAILARAPKLGMRIARTRAHLISAVVLAALVYLPSAWDTWNLRRRRLSARKQQC